MISISNGPVIGSPRMGSKTADMTSLRHCFTFFAGLHHDSPADMSRFDPWAPGDAVDAELNHCRIPCRMV